MSIWPSKAEYDPFPKLIDKYMKTFHSRSSGREVVLVALDDEISHGVSDLEPVFTTLSANVKAIIIYEGEIGNDKRRLARRDVYFFAKTVDLNKLHSLTEELKETFRYDRRDARPRAWFYAVGQTPSEEPKEYEINLNGSQLGKKEERLYADSDV
ncbi:MAG: hypothetical protein HYX24_01430 [Candidatus Aenigmarchaeota archaeon]|nr:hypothetical protein [Candidatus Aenigmarchaeota archaeon]